MTIFMLKKMVLPTARKSAAHFTGDDTSARLEGSTFAPTLATTYLLVSATNGFQIQDSFPSSAVPTRRTVSACEEARACPRISRSWRSNFRSKVGMVWRTVSDGREALARATRLSGITNGTHFASAQRSRLCSASY